MERNYPGLQSALIFRESHYPKIPQLRRKSISYHEFLYVNHWYKSPCSIGVKYTERFSRQSFKRVPANSKVSLLWSVSMRFCTAKPSGTLLEISFSSSSSVPEVSYVNQGTCFKKPLNVVILTWTSFLFQLVDVKLSYNYKELLVLQLPHIAVNDTQCHHKSDMNYQNMYFVIY